MKPPEGKRPCVAIGKIGLCCRHQDIVDVRIMRYLTCKAAYREWNYPRKGGTLYAARLEQPSHLTPDIGNGISGFDDCLVGFCS